MIDNRRLGSNWKWTICWILGHKVDSLGLIRMDSRIWKHCPRCTGIIPVGMDHERMDAFIEREASLLIDEQ